MKLKKRLLHHVWLFAILMGWTSLAHAQTDVTSKYIKNAGFEESPVTYTKANGTTPQTDRIGTSGWIYTVTDWTYAGVCNHNAVQIATIEYGFESAVNGTNSTTPPTADNLGQTGTALAMSAGWGDDAIIEQETTLPPGKYSLTYYVNNRHTNTGIAVDFTGVKFADGRTKTGTLSSATQNTWTEGKVYFIIAKEQKVTFRVGFTTSAGGSGDGAKLYVDNLKLLKYDDASIDMTSWIANAGFEQGTETTSGNTINKPYGWNIDYKAAGWLDGSINTTAPNEGTKLYNAWAGQITSMDIYQEIELPVGKYRLSGDLRIDNTNNISDQGVYATFNGNTYKSTTITNVASTWNSLDGWNTLAVEFYNDAPDLVRIGISGTGEGTSSKGWFQVDNIQMQYLGKNLRDGSTQATSGVSATANTWYAIQVPIAGTYQLTPSAGTLYYTQNGELMPDDENAKTTSVTEATDLELTAGYLYINSTEASTVTLVANNKTYNVGNATPSISYIQAGQTVTVTYADATTNDTEATFAKLTGDVTLNNTPIDVTSSGNSFTFTVPEGLSPATKYDLVIHAGAFGYSGQTTCAEQTITFTTPAVFDGTYFIKATDATYGGKYISRGANSNTEAALDPWGLPVKVTTDANNVSTLYFVDNNKPLVLNDENIAYTDGNLSNANHKYTYTIAADDGGCTIYNIDKTKYIAAGVRENNEVAKASDAAYSWQFVTPADHTTEMTALKNSQAVTAADAADLSASTVDDLKEIVEAWQGNNTQNLTLTVNEYYSDSGNDGNAVGTRSNKVTIDKAGLYKFSMPAYTRASGVDAAYDNHLTETEALVAYIFFGNHKTQIRSLYSEAGTTQTSGYSKPAKAELYWPNNPDAGKTEFSAGKYANEIWMYLEAGTYEYGITNNSKGLCESWTYYAAPTLTLYSDNLYPTFKELYKKCEPWTKTGDYVDTYNSYSSYEDGTDNTTLQAAINYLNANFDTYAWDNASLEHPYLVEGVISRSDCTTNGLTDPITDWVGNGRSTTSGQHWSGDASRVYFTQNHENGAARSQTVTIPKKGIYMLKTSIRPITTGAYAEISVGGETLRTYGPTGKTGGTIATDGTEYESVEAGLAAGAKFANNNSGYGWIYNKLIFNTSSDNEKKTISINLSNVNDSREADCGGMFLYYVGQKYDKIEGDTHYYYGDYTTAPSFEVTDEVPIVDATKASVTDATVTRTNPNGLVYLASGSTASGNNVVVDGTCTNLVLTDGHPFKATKQFTATSASYTMSKVVETSNGSKFGTLMLPFAVETLPGKAYSLDADLNVIDGSINGREVTTITANKPVLVTAAGDYKGSNVDIAVTDASKQFTNGNLTGVYQTTDAPVGSYVLQNHTPRGVAFYLVQDVRPTVKPFRAFIPAQSSNVKSIKILFDGETTDISNIDTDGNADNDIIYDLSGRRVNKAHKGVYIINGKRIVK